jgi:glycosyltransferase involved in cell wall biosynthesis
MTKICVIHHSTGFGGGTNSFIDLLEMLITKHDVVACIPQNSSTLANKLKVLGIPFYEIINPISIFPNYSGGPSFFSRTFFKELIKRKYNQAVADEITNLKPDIVIFNTIVISFLAGLLNPSIKKICFVRETFNRSILNLLYKKNFESFFTGVCFIASHEEEYINLKKPYTKVIPDCLHPRNIAFLDRQEVCDKENVSINNFIILFMGGQDPIKGLDVLLKSLYVLKDDHITLLLAGSSNLEGLTLKAILKKTINPKFVIWLLKIKYYFRKVNQINKIHILGYRQDIAPLMCLADVVIFPSTKPHQPRPAIEAGEYYKTIIISDYECTKEYFIDHYNALVFKPGNAKSLASKIESLKNDVDLRKVLGQNNFLMTQRKHNYLEIKSKLLSFIDECSNSGT